MLIVPEHKTIFLMPPRTGSSTLHVAIKDCCPNAFMFYRHGEHAVIPAGYEAYRTVGFVRHPLARMWSLYKFCSSLDPRTTQKWLQEEALRVAESVQKFHGFEDWLLNNTELFLPQDTPYPDLFQAFYVPETRKSQSLYLAPETGTDIIPFSELAKYMAWAGLPTVHVNASPELPIPASTPAIELHLAKYMSWELGLGLEVI